MNFVQIFCIIIVILMLIPNMVYAYQNKNRENKCTNKLMNTAEQIGRYGSVFFMVVYSGFIDLGFHSKNAFVLWLIGLPILTALYWVLWVLYFKMPNSRLAMLLAIVPSAVFTLNGLALRYWLSVLFGVIFSIGHIYVTYQNHYSK